MALGVPMEDPGETVPAPAHSCATLATGGAAPKADPVNGEVAPNPVRRRAGESWLASGEAAKRPAWGALEEDEDACIPPHGSDREPARGVSDRGEAPPPKRPRRHGVPFVMTPGELGDVTVISMPPHNEQVSPQGVASWTAWLASPNLGDGAHQSIGEVMPSGDRGVMAPEASKLNWLGWRP